MSSPFYTVPEVVTFRNIAVLKEGQTRTLLLKNTHASTSCMAHVSKPFTPCFQLSLPAQQDHSWQSNPDSLEVVVPANGSVKVVVALRLPPDIPSNENIHDRLIVVMGTHVMVVPIQAIAQALDPASGAALQTLVANLSFWPPKEKLDSMAAAYTSSLSSRLGFPIVLPQAEGMQAQKAASQQSTAGSGAGSSHGSGASGNDASTCASSAQARSRPASGGPTGPAAPALTGPGHINPAVMSAVAGILGEAAVPAHITSQSSTSGRTVAAELPPDTFSVQPGTGDDDDKASVMSAYQPYTLVKPVVVQGRTAYAVGSTGATSGAAAACPAPAPTAAAAAEHVQANSQGRPSSGHAGAPMASEAGTRTSARSSRPPSSSSAADVGSTASSAAARVAFVIDGKAYDARGREMASVGDAGDMLRFTHTLVDCSEGARLHKSGSFGRMAGPLIESLGLPPPTLPATTSTAAAGAVSATGRPQTLAPLLHKPALQPVPQQASARGLDPTREAALAAAMREFGITNLPPPPDTAAAAAPATKQMPSMHTPMNGSPRKPLARILSAGSTTAPARQNARQLPASTASPSRMPHSPAAVKPAAAPPSPQLSRTSSHGSRDTPLGSNTVRAASQQRAAQLPQPPVPGHSRACSTSSQPMTSTPLAPANMAAPTQGRVQFKARARDDEEQDSDDDLEQAFEERLLMNIRAAGGSGAGNTQDLGASKGSMHGVAAARRGQQCVASNGAGKLVGAGSRRSDQGDDDGLVHDSFKDDISDAMSTAIEKQMASEREREVPVLQASKPRQHSSTAVQARSYGAQKMFDPPLPQPAAASVAKSRPPAIQTQLTAQRSAPTAAPAQSASKQKATLSPASKAELKRMQDAWDAL